MPPLARFITYRILYLPLTMLVTTMLLYGFAMLTPPEIRATLYFGAGADPNRLSPERIEIIREAIIRQYHLRDPFLVQYAIWAGDLLQGEWGWSPLMHDFVLAALLRRTPVTAELTIYSLLFFIPLGLVSGVLAGTKKDRLPDYRFRLAAFVFTSLPIFILSLVLMSIFYVALNWFPPERISLKNSQVIRSEEFHTFTGLLTIDGLLNNRPDISVDAARHLVLPVLALSLLHWATLGRVTRSSVIEEEQKDYILAGRARGIPERVIIWKHTLRNAITPALTSSALSAASLFTGVFVIEVIFSLKGISELVILSMGPYVTPDLPLVLGFAIYSILIVLLIMLFLDIIQAIFDPRIREGILNT
ncbi:MAG: ABC transporter permease [Chloroflexota bacterium]